MNMLLKKKLIFFKQGYGEGRGIELRDKNLLFLEFPGNEVLSFYDIKDVLDQYDCTSNLSFILFNIFSNYLI